MTNRRRLQLEIHPQHILFRIWTCSDYLELKFYCLLTKSVDKKNSIAFQYIFHHSGWLFALDKFNYFFILSPDKKMSSRRENSGNLLPPGEISARRLQEKIRKYLLKVTQNDRKLPMSLHFFFISRKIYDWEFYYFLCLSWFLFTLLTIYYKYFDTAYILDTYFSTLALLRLKNMVKMSRIYACVKIFIVN